MAPKLGTTIFEISRNDTVGVTPPPSRVPVGDPAWHIPREFLRETRVEWPEVSEPEVVRHYVRLSTLNHHIDKDTYPLGSCTMKYNPKINERTSALPGFARLHPETPDAGCQGALRLMWELAQDLAEITGMNEVCLQPSAGAQGEMVGLLIARAHHHHRGEDRRGVVIPES